jgi:SpoVK/Ycf46/Vps4 family AAA+-type ATPase
LALKTEGFSGAQIASVCNRAALRAVRRAVACLRATPHRQAASKNLPAGLPPKTGVPKTGGSGADQPPAETQAQLLIESDDLEAALAEVAPKP